MMGQAVLEKHLLKTLFTSHLGATRCEAYTLVQEISLLYKSDIAKWLSETTPIVFNCLGEKNSTCHDAMWDLLLTWIKARPLGSYLLPDVHS